MLNKNLIQLINCLVARGAEQCKTMDELYHFVHTAYVRHYTDWHARQQADLHFRFFPFQFQEEAVAYHQERESSYWQEVIGEEDTSIDLFKSLEATFSLSSPGYGGWGFTPLLAHEAEALHAKKEKDITPRLRLNCLGFAILMGSMCKLRNLPTKMVLQPDHNFVIAEHVDGLYLHDIWGNTEKLNGKLTPKDSYFQYIPDDKKYKQYDFVHDFSRAMIYEILENAEVLRRMLLDKKDLIQLQPGYTKEGLSIAMRHAEVLKRTSWSDLQAELFPEITHSFYKYKNEWNSHLRKAAEQRKKDVVRNIVTDAFKNALLGRDRAHDKHFWSELMPRVHVYRSRSLQFKKLIIQYLFCGTPLPGCIPRDVRQITTDIRREVLKKSEGNYGQKAFLDIAVMYHRTKDGTKILRNYLTKKRRNNEKSPKGNRRQSRTISWQKQSNRRRQRHITPRG